MTLTDPTMFAVFKTTRLGDLIDGFPTLKLAGEDVELKSGLYGTVATFNDRGAKSWYEATLAATLSRSWSSVETVEGFWQRRMVWLAALKSTRGGTGLYNYGTLAIGMDQQKLYKLSGSESAGSNVQIGVSAPFGGALPFAFATGEKWYIFDPNTGAYEYFTTSNGTTASYVEAATLTNNYTSAAYTFRASMILPGAFLSSGIEIAGGDTEGHNDAARDIALVFQSADSPTYGVEAS